MVCDSQSHSLEKGSQFESIKEDREKFTLNKDLEFVWFMFGKCGESFEKEILWNKGRF